MCGESVQLSGPVEDDDYNRPVPQAGAGAITVNEAPWRSIRPAKRPIGMSIGSFVTVAQLAGLGDGGVAVGDGEAHAPVRRDLGREVLVGHLHHPADGLAVGSPDG